MHKFAIAAAAVLLSAGVAAAQSDAPPAPGAAPEAAPPAAAPVDGGAPMPGHRHGRPDGMRGHHGKMMHKRGGPHGHGPMMPPSKGASFMFAAPGEGRIMIKCADEDSTQACADAVKPILEMMLNAGGSKAQ